MAELNELSNREHDQIAGIKRVTLFPATSLRLIDESGAPSTTYVGVAAAGTAQADNAWLVERISVSGTDTMIDHATGAWSDRGILTYT
jgi:hypothetical protein